MDPVREPTLGGMGGPGIAWFAGLAAIIGYSGYRRAEERSGSDKSLRMEIARRLDDLKSRLSRVCQAEASCVTALDCEKSTSRIEKLCDQISKGDYGIASLFDATEMGEADLDALTAYDRGAIEKLDQMNELLTANPTCAAPDLMPNWERHMDELETVIEDRRRFIGRARV